MKKLVDLYLRINKGEIKAFVQLYGLLNGIYEIVSVNPRNWTISIKTNNTKEKYLTIPASPDIYVFIMQ